MVLQILATMRREAALKAMQKWVNEMQRSCFHLFLFFLLCGFALSVGCLVVHILANVRRKYAFKAI